MASFDSVSERCLECDGRHAGECRTHQSDQAVSAVVASCGCGKRYTADGWAQLKYVGVMPIPAGADGPAYKLEMRDCPCRSTISVVLS